MRLMKKRYYIVVFLGSYLCAEQGDFLIDTIKAVVEGPLNTEVVLQSDIARRGFDGVSHSANDLAIEIVKDQHGEELGLSIGNEDVDQYLRAMAQGSDVSKESLISMGKEFGYADTDEFYYDLRRLYRANTTMDQEIRSYLAVSEQEIRDYYGKNSEYKEGAYYIQTALVSFRDDMSNAELKKALEHPEKSAKIGRVEWGLPFDITYSELAEDKSFIKKQNVGDVHVIERQNGFELFKLKNHIKPTEVSFDERRQKILEKIREEKFSKVFNSYNDEIMKTATVTYY